MAYIISIVSIVLAGVFALLVKAWVGFAYFVLATMLLLSLFWFVWLIYKYFTDFKKELEERFEIFRVETINKYQITTQYFDEHLPEYKKEFSKKALKDKTTKWCMIAFCLACAVAFLLGMIFYK